MMAEVQSHSPQTSDIKLTRVFTRTPSSWDPQDDLLLRHLKEQQKLGWKEIASHFSHRTPNACQFRWRRLRSGSLKAGSTPTSTASSTPGPVAINNNNTAAAIVAHGSVGSNTSTPSQPSSSLNVTASPLVSPPLGPTNNAAGLAKFTSIPPQFKSSSSPIKIASSNGSTEPVNVSVNYNKWSFNNNSRYSSVSSSKDEPDPLSRSFSTSSSSSSSASSSDDDELLTDKTAIVTTANIWSPEEDQLLLARRERQLSFTELSILLPLRTELQIQDRISQLEEKSKSTSALIESSSSSSSFQPTTTITTSNIKRHNHHSHPHPLHTSSSSMNNNGNFIRSYSNSSQTSIASTSSFLLTQDSTRSKSFSHPSPYPLVFSERFNSPRKNSISNPSTASIPITYSKKQRSHSMRYASPINSITSLRTGSFSYYNSSSIASDDEDTTTSIHYNTSNIRVEPIKNSVPPVGALFNE